MNTKNALLPILLLMAAACGQRSSTGSDQPVATSVQTPGNEITEKETPPCKPGEELIYENNGLSSYTEDRMRGSGVLSFQLDARDRLEILNADGSIFGEIVLNDDQTFFTIAMPRKIVARLVIPEYDLAAFDFDAEEADKDPRYLLIYVNGEQRKVRKEQAKFRYHSWDTYLRSRDITLKECNALPEAATMHFKVRQVNGDKIKLQSIHGCGEEEGQYKDLEGTINWRSGQNLLVRLSTCG
jgi:hypothetical protein